MAEDIELKYFPVSVCTFVIYLLTFYYLNPRLTLYFVPEYKLLSREKQLNWNCSINSTVNAVIVSVICLYVLLFEDEVSKNPVWADAPLVKTNCAIMVGYLLQDTLVQIIYYKQIGEANYILHHLASTYAFYYVTTRGALPWFANFRLIAEFSTPLVNQRWFLHTLGYQRSSDIYVMNGLAMCAMFFMVRILSIPPYWYKVYLIYGTEAAARLGYMWFVLISTCLVLDLLNVIWFRRMMSGALKVISARQDLINKEKAS